MKFPKLLEAADQRKPTKVVVLDIPEFQTCQHHGYLMSIDLT